MKGRKIFLKVFFGLVGAALFIIGLLLLWQELAFKSKNHSEFVSPLLEKESPKIGNDKILKFAVLSDIHLDTVNLQKALEKAKIDQVEFVIITGDLTALGKTDELEAVKEVLEASGLKYYVIPGNHDLWFGKKVGKNVFGEVFGAEYQSFKDDNTKFILVNNGGSEGISFTQEQWLKNEVAECQKIYCLIFAHMPFNHGSSEHIMGEDSEKAASQAAGLVRLFVENRVKEVFVGHLHYSTSYEIEGLRTTIVGAITSDRNIQTPRFLEIEKWGDNLVKKIVVLE